MKKNKRKWSAVALIVCLVVVGAWEVASKLAARKWEAFELTGEDFEDFTPQSDSWSFEKRQLGEDPDPRAPNIIAYRMKNNAGGRPVLVRLVHGYNMPDCMRIKHYDVKLIADNSPEKLTSEEGQSGPGYPSYLPNADESGRIQVWLLESPAGETAVWVTRMIRTVDFSATGKDVRSMAFPRIGTPDNPDWTPEGLRLKSLKHPIRNLKQYLRAKWNASRSDVLTFLKLKQPAWASRKMLTLVGISQGRSVEPHEVDDVAARVVRAVAAFYDELREYEGSGVER